MDRPLVWAEIDLRAIAYNVQALRRITRPGARLMAVVKANGYGHGAVPVARCALENGADLLGVARINEGIELRKAGLAAPILILGYTPPALAEKLMTFDLTAAVSSYAAAAGLARAAAARGKKIEVHLKVDTGMGRLGLLPTGEDATPTSSVRREPLVQQVNSIFRLSGLQVTGIFTHLATADRADKSYARQQLQKFTDILDRLSRAGMQFSVRHAANSAALIDLPESHFDLVRPGIALYGLYPSDEVHKKRVHLQPAMALKARIVQLKSVGAGFKVSYGITHETPRPTTIATVPVGYADGLNRRLSSRGCMLVGGQRASIIGRICMDLTMVDVGAIAGVNLEDEVVIFGRQGAASITADEIAATLNTINYEVVSTIAARVPRIYLP